MEGVRYRDPGEATYKEPRENDASTKVFWTVPIWSLTTGATGSSRIDQSRRVLEMEFPHRNGLKAMQCPGFVGCQALSTGVHWNNTEKNTPKNQIDVSVPRVSTA